MTVISKQLFYEKISDEVQCSKIHVWSENCFRAQLILFFMVFKGAIKFFLPIYVVKALMNYRKFKDKIFWKSLLVEYVRSIFYGVALANSFVGPFCLLCKLNGRLNYYSVTLLPGLVSGLGLLVESKENKMLDTLIFFNLLVEAAFRNINYFRIFKLTNNRETILFMAVSSLLMYLLQNREKGKKLTNLWFYTPHTLKTHENITKSKSCIERKCGHKEACAQFAITGAQKYFILGYLFSIVRKFIPRMLTLYRKPSQLYSVLVNKENLKFGIFIGAYVGIYRYVICYLLKTQSIDQKYFGAIAGLISGATYAISPSLQVLTVGITTILQVFYNGALKRLQLKNQWPQQLVYMFSHALLLHNACMCRDTCPTYYLNMLDTATSNIFRTVYKNLIMNYFL